MTISSKIVVFDVDETLGYFVEFCIFWSSIIAYKIHEKIDYELTQIIGDNVYKPWDCLSGIYQVEINERMGLVARPNGITNNNECVVMVDDYLTKFYKSNTEEELKIKLLSTMAVWKAKKGVYIITKMKKNIYIEFDNSKWEEILFKLKLWGESAFEM